MWERWEQWARKDSEQGGVTSSWKVTGSPHPRTALCDSSLVLVKAFCLQWWGTPPGTRTRLKGDLWLLEVSLPSFPSVSLLVLGMKLFYTIAANIHISRKAKAIYLGDELKPLNTLHRKLWPRLKFKKWNGQWHFLSLGLFKIPVGQVSGPQQLESDPLHPDPITLSPSFTE